MRARVVAVSLLLLPSLLYAQWQDDGVPLCTATASQQATAAVADGAGGAFVVWTDARNGAGDIYAQRVDAAGNPLWTVDGIAVCAASQDQSAPVIIADGTGGVIIAWHDWRNQATLNQDLYVQRLNGSGVAQWAANGVVLASAAAGQHYPRMLSDGAGGAIAAWLDFRNSSLNGETFATRLTSTGTLPDGVGGVDVSTATGGKTPWSILSFNGGALIAMIDTRNGAPDIYVARFTSAGAVLDPTGIPICVLGGDQQYPMTITDGAGGAIIAWSDIARNGEIFAQRINSTGVIQWTLNGVAVGADILSSVSQQPQMVSDGVGGAILSWVHYDGADPNVYAQRINASGAKQWGTNSLPVCTASEDQTILAIAPDNAGGAVLGWGDRRNLALGYDIFAQRVYSNGTVAWLANGVVVCDDSADQPQFTLVPDLDGGAIFAWTDRRPFFQSDIYAHRLTAGGNIPTAIGDTPTVARLGQNYPNPFNPETSIPFSLARAGRVRLRVYEVDGRFVATLLDENRSAGEHVARWDGRDARGRASASGVYFARLEANGTHETRKIALLK